MNVAKPTIDGALQVPYTALLPNQRTGAAEQLDSGAETAQPQKILFNPRIRFDYDANVIVMEFRSRDTGEVTRSVPNERQLQAYVEASRLPLTGSDEARIGSGRRTGGNGAGSSTASEAPDALTGTSGVDDAARTSAPRPVASTQARSVSSVDAGSTPQPPQAASAPESITTRPAAFLAPVRPRTTIDA